MEKEDVAKTDWSKIAMGIAVAIVFVMQQYHAMMLTDVQETVAKHTQLNGELEFNQVNRKKVFKDIDIRLKALEEKR